MKCLECQVETENPKFCSRSCATRSNNRGKQRNPPIVRVCFRCSEPYRIQTGVHESTRVCRACKDNRDPPCRDRTIGEHRSLICNAGRHPSWLHATVRQLCRTWNANMRQQPCENCGYDKHVELCHVRSLSDFPDDAKLSEVNSPDNIRVLCRNCHWEFDNGLLD